jgi:hypothetical protein
MVGPAVERKWPCSPRCKGFGARAGETQPPWGRRRPKLATVMAGEHVPRGIEFVFKKPRITGSTKLEDHVY